MEVWEDQHTIILFKDRDQKDQKDQKDHYDHLLT